jgi:predicted RND superfamily exporter protein
MPSMLKFNCSRPDFDESAQIKAALQNIRKSPWGTILTGKSANDIFFSFYLSDTLSADSRYGKFDNNIVGEIMSKFKSGFLPTHSDIEASWGGVGVFQYYLKEGYDQTAIINLGTVIILLGLFWFLFGTIRSGLLFLLSFLISMMPTYGGMALFKAPIDVLSNSLSLMVLIASLEDFIFVSHSQLTEENFKKSSKNWRKPFRQLLIPSFFTSLTTVVGFGSLAIADLDIVRRFGIWAAFAVGMEFFSVFYFLPALMQIFPSLRIWTKAGNQKRFAWAEKLKFAKIPRRFALFSLVIYAIGMLGANSLSISDAPANVFPKDHIVRTTLDKIEKSRGWQTEVSLVFNKHNNTKVNQEKLEKILQHPQIKGVENPFAIEDFVQADLPESRKSMVLSLWNNSPMAKRLVNDDDNKSRAILYLGSTDIVDINKLTKFANEICGNDCHLAGTLVSYGEFGERVLTTFMSSLTLSLIIVMLVLTYLIIATGQKEFFPMLASAMWGPFILLTVFIVFQIPIFYVTSIFASILIGLAGDNTIQYIFANSRGHNLQGSEKLGGASLILTLCMCAISTALFFSYFGPLRFLGVLMILGFIFAVIGDLFIFRSLRSDSLK